MSHSQRFLDFKLVGVYWRLIFLFFPLPNPRETFGWIEMSITLI